MSEFEREGRYDEPEAGEPEVAEVETEETEVKETEAEEPEVEAVEPEQKQKYVFVMPPLVKTALVLFLITAVSAAMLAGVYMITEGPIAGHTQEAVDSALNSVLPGCDSYAAAQDAEMTGSAGTLYIASKGGEAAGFAVMAAPQGYGGPITIVVGVDASGAVTGVSVVSMSETAGLGTKCQSPEYLLRFTGKHAGLTVGRGENDVDAITGATVSSRAVTQGVADALATVAAYQAGKE